MLTAGVVLLVSVGAGAAGRAADAGTVRKLHGHVPAIVSQLSGQGVTCRLRQI